MRKITLTGFLLAIASITSFAQLPVTSGLQLHLDAAVGFNANGAAAATWQDLSPANNDVTAGNSLTFEPTWTSNASGTGFAGVTFNGSSNFMFRSATNTSGFSTTNATLFVVRIGNTDTNTTDLNNYLQKTLLSIGDGNTYNGEFGLLGDWAINTTQSGVWLRRTHQCYSSLPDTLPVVLTAVLGTNSTVNDIDYYVNGIISTDMPAFNNQPQMLPYAPVQRSIVVGARYDANPNTIQAGTYFKGDILEVIAYNRILTSGEIDSVNQYLKCKYGITYGSCNTTPICYNPTSNSCNDTCYWKVTGNTILGGNNYFGTNSNDDISIGTNSIIRGVIKSGNVSTGGYFGLNTTNPTARLHIDCNAGNSASGTSDVRFENLESGDGYLLAINSLGYVLKTSQTSMTPTNYWNIFGNTASPYGNFLGTNNAVDVILRTNNINKGIWTSGTSGAPGDDGRLGWQTLNPTAHLHINCAGGNPDDGGAGSDVRFEALEPGRGNILVIDDEGYVYNSGKPLDAYKSAVNEAKIEKLEKEVEELKAQIETLLNPTNQSKREATVDQNQLFQNTPNPFGKETKIEFYIHDMMQSASITINDLNGRMLKSYPINQKGMGSVLVTGDDMTPGIYLYSLVIDGREIDTKRMVVSK